MLLRGTNKEKVFCAHCFIFQSQSRATYIGDSVTRSNTRTTRLCHQVDEKFKLFFNFKHVVVDVSRCCQEKLSIISESQIIIVSQHQDEGVNDDASIRQLLCDKERSTEG